MDLQLVDADDQEISMTRHYVHVKCGLETEAFTNGLSHHLQSIVGDSIAFAIEGWEAMEEAESTGIVGCILVPRGRFARR